MMSTTNLDKHIQAMIMLESVATDAKLSEAWVKHETVLKSFNRMKEKFQTDYDAVCKRQAPFFNSNVSVEESTALSHAILQDWHTQGQVPSLTAMMCHAIDRMRMFLEPDLYMACVLCAMLGDVENTTLYHNNTHYNKVLLQLIRMLVYHNNMFRGSKRALGHERMAQMMMTACVHDLGHDGTGNMQKGVFEQSRLEKRSIDILAPYLAQIGINSNSDVFKALSMMILATDVTPITDPSNPSNQTQAAYKFHYMGDNIRVDSLHLDEAMKPLQKDDRLTLMALMLHEADVATSAGLAYDLTQFETILYRAEVCEDEGRPSHLTTFFDNIFQRQYLTDAARHLFGTNMARIYAQAESDVEAGDKPFGTLEANSFLHDPGNVKQFKA